MGRQFNALLFSMLLSFGLKAQFNNCVDSTRINPFQPCTLEFAPVCGCDNNTYDNSCTAYWWGGVNTISYSGVCQNDLFAFTFSPNPIVSQMNFRMQLASDLEYDGSITIADVYGNVVYFKLLKNLTGDFPYLETIPMYGLETGMYIIHVRVGAVSQIKKFVKFRI